MKAKIKPRIELENRTKLEEVIPIEVPFLVFLDPSDVCNFQCKFCPTGDRALIKKIKRNSCLMDFDLFKKVIDDLCEFKKPIKVLRLYKDGEPLLNPRFPDMVRYAKKSGCALQIDTTTNGSLLNPRLNLKIIEAGLDRIHISLEGLSQESYKEFAGYRINFEKFVDNIRHYYEHKKECLVCIKIVGDNLSKEAKGHFFDIFGNISDRIFVEHIAPCWPQFEMHEVIPNSNVGIYGQEIKEVEVCPYIFYSISINADGKVSLCFLDWARELIVGDARAESIKDIWNNEIMFNYRKMHLLKKRKEHKICAVCGQLSHCLPDDIDPFAEMLLKKLNNTRRE
ncbi:radical SAM/SPASM domain-containing protein [Desulfobacula sp.]|uniref:radical SAM/SPASM domain-containing protein n=1 Tax=Desulfobacula sp. TaxID=2593537 RepID=UPI00262AF5B4|nr:radical SAM/SPASM domain-containing protein [Desulfobacula sp.]